VTRNNFNVGLGASWELDLWGRIQRTVEAADANVDASVADLEGVRLAAQAELAQDYLLLRVQDAVIALLQESVAAYERSVQLTTNQFNVGVVGRVDVAQAEVQLKSTQAQLIDASLQRAQLEHAIAVLIGKPPSEADAGAFTCARRVPRHPARASIGVARTPSRYRCRRASHCRRQCGSWRRRRGVLSLVDAFGNARFPELGVEPIAVGAQPLLVDRTRAGANLFDAGLRRAKSAQALAAYDESVATYRETVLTSFQEVEDNLAALRILAQEADVQDDAVRAVREVVTIRNNQYRAGISELSGSRHRASSGAQQ
jgi:outer membrane protein TolC